MKNKRIIITGATSGVGKEVASGLAALGAELVLACRDVKQGEKTAREIGVRTGNPNIVAMRADTSSYKSVRDFAQEYRARYDRLDVLINNAALNQGTLPRTTSVDGIELTFATNVLGYYWMTQFLLDLLKQSAPARIVNVASQFASDLDLDDFQFERRRFEAAKAYAQSKACDRLLTWATARRLKGSRVTANAMTPGLIVDTGLYRHSPPELVSRLRTYSRRTIADGADTAIWLASSDEVDGISGKFFVDRKKVSCEFRDKATEERVWSICERITNSIEF